MWATKITKLEIKMNENYSLSIKKIDENNTQQN